MPDKSRLAVTSRLIDAYLAEHICSPEGVCSCGWDVANYDLAPKPYAFDKKNRPLAFGYAVSPVEAWTEHITRTWMRANPLGKFQLAQAPGPGGVVVGFELETGHDSLSAPHRWGSDQSWEAFVESRHSYHGAYRYDDYERPPETEGSMPMKHLTCEEAGCRDPRCYAGHFRFSVKFPEICGGCKKPFTDDEVRVAVMVQPKGPTTLVEGSALASTASYHEACVPPVEKLRKRSKKMDKENMALAKAAHDV